MSSNSGERESPEDLKKRKIGMLVWSNTIEIDPTNFKGEVAFEVTKGPNPEEDKILVHLFKRQYKKPKLSLDGATNEVDTETIDRALNQPKDWTNVHTK